MAKAIVKSVSIASNDEMFRLQVTYSLLHNAELSEENVYFIFTPELGLTTQMQNAIINDCLSKGITLEPGNCIVPNYNI